MVIFVGFVVALVALWSLLRFDWFTGLVIACFGCG